MGAGFILAALQKIFLDPLMIGMLITLYFILFATVKPVARFLLVITITSIIFHFIEFTTRTNYQLSPIVIFVILAHCMLLTTFIIIHKFLALIYYLICKLIPNRPRPQ